MHYSYQNHYKEFRCIAEKCPESCCKYWQIYSDDDTLEKYRLLAEKDPRIARQVDFDEGCFRQKDRICGFLDPDELCYLQRNYGEKFLCDTCRNYPRHEEEFENVREYSLSLSCPEAARILFEDHDRMTFEESDDEEEEEFEDFDCLLYDALLDVRDFLFETAQNRKIPLSERLILLEQFGVRYQELLEEGNLFGDEELKETFRQKMKKSDRNARFRQFFDREKDKRIFSVLYTLEQLHSDWTEKLDAAGKIFFEKEEYPAEFGSFLNKHEIQGEQILMLLLYTYFCGAVYDGWAGSKIFLAVYSVKWIFMLAFACGGTEENLRRTAWQYAREIEHSDINLEKVEEYLNQTVYKNEN